MTKKKGVVEAPPIEETPKTKPVLTKTNVTAKQIGKNLNVVVGEEKFTRVGTTDELQSVKDAAKLYNEKPTKNNMTSLMKLLRPETVKKEAEVEKVKAEVKATKKKVEAKEKEVKSRKTVVADVVKEIDDKLMSTTELDEMQKAIDRQREKKQVEAKTTSRPSGGESYRGRY